ncbi:MAG: RluA family pseudouridine synthase [Aliifodinibius sp.]|nr:RluA family pseudouridine synthase [Fodinibius sp.]
MNNKVLNFEHQFQQSQRLDHFLVSQLPEHSRSFLQNLIKGGNVNVDGNIIQKTGFKLDGKHKITILIPPPEPSDIIPEEIPLKIIYEDDDLIVIDKEAGMVVHPSAGHSSGTLVHAILAHVPNLAGIGGVRRPGIVHRLDKETSGVLVVAKNDFAHQFLQAQFKQRRVEKTYRALVDSHPPTPAGRIEAAINRDPSHRQRMAIVPEEKGRMAISEYKTLRSFKNHTLLEVNILTGRTHQIRLHLAFLNCPVVGDRIYGHKNPSIPVKRHLLHAYRLVIDLPDGSKKMSFEAPLPADFQDVLERLT